MKKLRVAMFMSSNPIQSGGVQEHILHLSRQLRKRGHTVTLFGPQPNKNPFSHYRQMGEKIYFPLPYNNLGSLHILNEKNKPEKIFSKKNFDILHIHEPYIPFAAWNVLEKTSIPTIGTFHTVWDNESFFNIFNSFIPLFADRFSSFVHGAIFVSKITYEKWQGLCNKTIIKNIIPNAVDTSLFQSKKTENAPLRLLFVARIVHRKGLFPLLKAVNILKKRGLHFILTVIGDGSEKIQDLNYVKEYRLKKYVNYLGEINGKKRAKYFKEADIFCAPYVNEAASISVLEAISAGLPVVGYNIPIFSDLLHDYPGKDLLVEKNEYALADALEKIMNNAQKREIIKKWCLAKRDSFSWETVARKTESLYIDVLTAYAEKNI